jgi:hypothetical protein
VEAGPTLGVADGYWILLEQMSVGKHEIHFSAEVSLQEGSKLAELARRFNKIKGTSFLTEVIYDLTISQQ